MILIRKNLSSVLLGLSLIFFYFLTRFYNILSLPIFTDEAIYIRWAQIAKNDAAWRFISLTDGKQPLFVWFTMIIMRFVEDPLLSGRLVSVFAGLFAMVGLFFLTFELFKNKKIAFMSSLIYIIYPFSLVYDRMALYDSLVSAFAVWSLYFEVLLVRKLRLDLALILGMILGGAMLTKSMASFFIYFLPFSLLIFNFSDKDKKKNFLRWIALALLSVVLAYFYFSILRLSPFFHIISEKNAIFVYPFSEWIQHPFRFFIGNMKGFVDWLATYMTLPLLLLVPTAFFIGKFFREKLLLFAWFLPPFVALALFGNVLYPRFIFFMTMPLLVLVAFTLIFISEKIKAKILKVVFFIICFTLAFRTNYLIYTDFSHAPVPKLDLTQYINAWPAGGGIRETVDFFQDESKKGKIYIATQGTFGLMPYSLEIYLGSDPNVKIVGYWPIGDSVPQEAVNMSRKMPTYFVFYQPCIYCKNPGEAPETWKMDLIQRYDKSITPKKPSYLSIYKVR